MAGLDARRRTFQLSGFCNRSIIRLWLCILLGALATCVGAALVVLGWVWRPQELVESAGNALDGCPSAASNDVLDGGNPELCNVIDGRKSWADSNVSLSACVESGRSCKIGYVSDCILSRLWAQIDRFRSILMDPSCGCIGSLGDGMLSWLKSSGVKWESRSLSTILLAGFCETDFLSVPYRPHGFAGPVELVA